MLFATSIEKDVEYKLGELSRNSKVFIEIEILWQLAAKYFLYKNPLPFVWGWIKGK
jgi:hypothetical protein